MKAEQIKHYTADCLRTWKNPNTSLLNKEDLAQVSEEMQTYIKDVVMNARTYEEIAHIIAGLSAEILSELEPAFAFRDTVNIKEEVGDIQYFLFILADRSGIDLTAAYDSSFTVRFDNPAIAKLCVDSPFKCLKYHAGELIDMLKKVHIYKNPKYGYKDIEAAALRLQISIERVANKNNFTASEAIENVIAKLKERFKEAFTVEEVSDRNLEAERKALEA